MSRKLRILTWHVHGNYLYNLTQVPHDFFLVVNKDRTPHHSGRNGSLPWGENVHDALVEQIPAMQFDVIVFQSREAWEVEQYRLLTPEQRKLPRIYIEHDPPQHHPTDTKHWVNDPSVLLVHVTPFNELMWDSGVTPTQVIEHGVRLLQETVYSGHVERGLVVVNNMASRGRRLGLDVYQSMRAQVPLALVGMASQELPFGQGEISQHELPSVMAAHRFFFHPIRYTSLGLAVIEAMLVGMPIVGLATTELVTVIRNDINGYIDTRPSALVEAMELLLKDRQLAAAWGAQARSTAMERFGIDRFVHDWLKAFQQVTI